jgi:hypothetical protein
MPSPARVTIIAQQISMHRWTLHAFVPAAVLSPKDSIPDSGEITRGIIPIYFTNHSEKIPGRSLGCFPVHRGDGPGTERAETLPPRRLPLGPCWIGADERTLLKAPWAAVLEERIRGEMRQRGEARGQGYPSPRAP